MALDFDEGSTLATFVWEPKDGGEILGMTRQHHWPVQYFFPTSDDAFVSWDPSTRISVSARFVPGRDTVTLILENGTHVLRLERDVGDRR